MQVEVDVKCMQTNFGGHGLSGFRDFACRQKWPNFPFEPWTKSMAIKKLNWLKTFMQVEVDVKCMQTI